MAEPKTKPSVRLWLIESIAPNAARNTRGSITFIQDILNGDERTVSPWGDVGRAIGGGFGAITSAAIVAKPSAIHIFFIDFSGGRYRLWHTVRFSANGSWRPVKNVLALSGDAPNGTEDSY